MGSKGGFILLLILAVLCRSGHSLKCYSCALGETCNRTTVCSVNHDSCLLVKTEPRLFYHQCWKLDDCSYLSISKALGLKNLEYSCCQKDLCNGSARVSGMTALMLFPLLAAVLTLCL